MSTSPTHTDVIVIGAGIAGASVAAELSKTQNVVLVERESQPGYHTTGRSAALFTVAYGPPLIRAMSRASKGYFHGELDAPQGLLRSRGVMFIARDDQEASVDTMLSESAKALRSLTAQEACDLAPVLRPDYVAQAVIEDGASDIDVHGLLHDYLKKLKANGGNFRTRAEAMAVEQDGSDWRVETTSGEVIAPVVINAAGAWADQIAKLAGARPLGLQPKRRTAVMVSAPSGINPDGWPMVNDVDELFYVRPDAGKLMMSPADTTPVDPCDIQPEELDVAICVDRVEKAMDLGIRRIEHKWAGLRSFFSDGNPVLGFDPTKSGFFWLAGQGGYGIQSAPAMARTAAALATGGGVPSDVTDAGFDLAGFAPERPELAD